MASSRFSRICLSALVLFTGSTLQAQDEGVVPLPADELAGFVQLNQELTQNGERKYGAADVAPQEADVVADADLAGDLSGDLGEGGDGGIDNFFDASLDSLASTQVTPDLNFEVTSVARDETSIGKSPAAIFVITNEMIQRSGARTLQDALRMVPGMHVARQVNGVFAIGMRGHAGSNIGDMLVQVDGRSIYNRTFGGTFWGSQEFVLEDIERIEVIRGPGASVWGPTLSVA